LVNVYDKFIDIADKFVFNKSSLAPKLAQLKETILSYVYELHDKFDVVEIETISICNRRCPYCPQSVLDIKKSEQGMMKWELFKKIIDELAAMKFKGSVRLHRFGEPLLDRRLPIFVWYVREKLPEVYIHIYTNGDFLTKELAEELIKQGADLIDITLHVDSTDTNFKPEYHSTQRVKIINEKIRYNFMTPGIILNNRLGLIKLENQYQLKHCSYATRMLEIDWKGQVLLCCNQFNDNTGPIIGNLNQQTIEYVWNSPFFKALRKDLRHGNFDLEICRKCGWGKWS
jgi:8-amino-3,8-dideoxy-alpha-D-manno-octulosonate transaminase